MSCCFAERTDMRSRIPANLGSEIDIAIDAMMSTTTVSTSVKPGRDRRRRSRARALSANDVILNARVRIRGRLRSTQSDHSEDWKRGDSVTLNHRLALKLPKRRDRTLSARRTTR